MSTGTGAFLPRKAGARKAFVHDDQAIRQVECESNATAMYTEIEKSTRSPVKGGKIGR